MNNAVKSMLEKYELKSSVDYENALKEIIQEITLLGLWRSKFFEKAAFYGGTALRLLYGLDRFSEDMDFSLYEPDMDFKIEKYFKAVKDELSSFGLDVSVEQKEKKNSNIESAFIKAGTVKNFIEINVPSDLLKSVSSSKMLKIKIEVDIDPPGMFETEAKYIFNPIPFSVSTYKIPYLFAGKMHAILCRQWKTRVKGRDWYDLVWYVGNNHKLSLSHLEKRLQQTGHLTKEDKLDEKKFRELIKERIETVDFDKARADVEPFLKSYHDLSVWSTDFFTEVGNRIELIEEKDASGQSS